LILTEAEKRQNIGAFCKSLDKRPEYFTNPSFYIYLTGDIFNRRYI
jgi:hypothetical protein